MSLGKGLHLQALKPLWPQAVAGMTLPWLPVHLVNQEKKNFCPWQCIMHQAAFLETQRNYDAGSLLLKRRILGTHPLAVPKIQAWYMSVWPLCHGSLEFPEDKTEPSNINPWRNEETGKAQRAFQSPNWNILQGRLIHGQKEMAVISHSLRAVSAGRASLSLGKGVGERWDRSSSLGSCGLGGTVFLFIFLKRSYNPSKSPTWLGS